MGTSSNHYVLLGLANVRSTWFRDVGRWATAGAIPAEFIRCVSVEEIRARLAGGRSFSALLLDTGSTGVDRDLLDTARQSGTAVLVVDDGRSSRDWVALGATAVLPGGFHRSDLLDELERHGRPLDRHDSTIASRTPSPGTAGSWSGRVVALTGGSGAGSSVAAMALAQGLGGDPRYTDLTLLADLALNADLAMLHDARDIVPGLQELVEAHRTGNPSPAEIRSIVFDASDRGYHLLLGLRRHRDWTVLRQRALAATLDSLSRAYRVVVADIDADVEGEDEVGSADIEDRNLLARSAVRRADLVVAVGNPTTKGIHDLLRVLADLVSFGVDPTQILPVMNRSVRPGRQRAEVAAAFGDLAKPISTQLSSPLHLPDRKNLEAAIRDGVALPTQLTEPITSAVTAALDRLAHTRSPGAGVEPVPIKPGELGHFADGGYLEGEAS